MGNPSSEQGGVPSPRRPILPWWRIISLAYLALGLLSIGDMHSAMVTGVGYLAIAWAYERAHNLPRRN